MSRLQWHEPAAYRRGLHIEHEAQHPWRTVRNVALCMVALLAFRGYVEWAHLRNGQFPNRPGWLLSVPLAAIMGVTIGFWLPRLILLLPGSIVILSKKGVNNNVIMGEGVHTTFWPWERIDHARFGKQTVRGREFRVLILYDAENRALATFALRKRPDVAEIAAYFQQQGKLCDDQSQNRAAGADESDIPHE